MLKRTVSVWEFQARHGFNAEGFGDTIIVSEGHRFDHCDGALGLR